MGTSKSFPAKPKLVPRPSKRNHPPVDQQQPSDTDKSWSEIVRGNKDEHKDKEMAAFNDPQGSGDANWSSPVADSAGYHPHFRILPYQTSFTRLLTRCMPPYSRLNGLFLTDRSEFPQLSNNAQLPGASQSSMWGGQAARNLSGPARNPSTSIPQQAQQDDIFSPVSRLPSQNSFRFGSQASIGQSQQPQPSGGEEFPPLNRNGNGEIGQERSASLMAGLGFGSQGAVASSSAEANRSGNGLLNAVTANARTSEVRSPVGMCHFATELVWPARTNYHTGTRPSDGIPLITDDEARRKSSSAQPGLADAGGPSTEMRNPLGAIGNDGSGSKPNDALAEASSSAAQDPLAGMSEADKWGIKGLLALMAKYPAYNALVHGMNPAEFGLDLNSDV